MRIHTQTDRRVKPLPTRIRGKHVIERQVMHEKQQRNVIWILNSQEKCGKQKQQV